MSRAKRRATRATATVGAALRKRSGAQRRDFAQRSSVCDVFATNGSKNMGGGRAEPRTAYAVLAEGERNAVKQKRSVPEAFKFGPLLFSIPFIEEFLKK